MSETVKLIIEIPKETLNLIKTFKGKFICNGYDLIQGVQNGIPLDDVKAEMQKLADDPWFHIERGSTIQGLESAIEILDNVGKMGEREKEEQK